MRAFYLASAGGGGPVNLVPLAITMAELNLRITERARRYIDELLRAHPVDALPALMFGSSTTYDKDGRLVSETPLHFSLTAYPLEQAQQIERDSLRRGYPVMHNVGGLTICIPQSTLVTELVEGKTLDVAGTTVSVT